MSVKTYTVEQIIAYARENSKYYAQLYRNLPEKVSLTDLPLIDPDDFWANCLGIICILFGTVRGNVS